MKVSLRSLGRIIAASSPQNPQRFAVFIPQHSLQFNHSFHTSVAAARKNAADEVDAKLLHEVEWHSVPKVSIASIPSRNNQPACYAIYWGDNDPMNVLKTCTSSRPSIFHASIDSMLLALRQAIHERNLEKVIVRTDNDYLMKCATRYLPFWRNNGYKKKDGETVKHKEDLQDLDTMLSQIQVKFEKIESPTEVFNKLKDLSDDTVNVDQVLDDPDLYKSSTAGNIIFVHGAYHEKDNLYSDSHKYRIAAYGIRFKDNESFDIKDRMSKYPYTLLRAQMYGIIKALELAKVEEIKDVRIVCDSPVFIKFHKRGWKKLNGEPVANDYLYRQIAKLAEELNVTFQYFDENDPKNPNAKSPDPDFLSAKLLAHDGLGMPVRYEDK